MSRVHDALRRAEQAGLLSPPAARPSHEGQQSILATAATLETGPNLAGLLEQIEEVPYRAATDSLLIDISRPHEAPMEEFRTLRTRLNHMKSLQPDPYDGGDQPFARRKASRSRRRIWRWRSRTWPAICTLLADFDFRRPIVHTLFGSRPQRRESRITCSGKFRCTRPRGASPGRTSTSCPRARRSSIRWSC